MAMGEAGQAGPDDGGSPRLGVVGTADYLATSHPSSLLESLCCLAAGQHVVERRDAPPFLHVTPLLMCILHWALLVKHEFKELLRI